ncbi:type I-E CRISPR-associated protein Cas6/Cse3/CasE [Dermacoccus abyssi]
MYFTQMKLNPSRDGTRRALASDQVMHAMVLSSFPHLTSGDRVLWRVDLADRHEVTLYVVSPAKPDMTGIVEQAGWPLEQTWRTASYDGFLGRLEQGQRWRFRLSANPTVSESRGPGVRGKVRPCRTVGQQEEWLRRRAVAMGVSFGDDDPSFVVSRRGTSKFSRADSTSGRRGRVQLTKATYEGGLEVVDPDRLRAVLVNGVGRGKAYGCGLLTLAQP